MFIFLLAFLSPRHNHLSLTLINGFVPVINISTLSALYRSGFARPHIQHMGFAEQALVIISTATSCSPCLSEIISLSFVTLGTWDGGCLFVFVFSPRKPKLPVLDHPSLQILGSLTSTQLVFTRTTFSNITIHLDFHHLPLGAILPGI